MTVLAIVGRKVPDIELGTAVVPTYPRHPVVMAQQALTAQNELQKNQFQAQGDSIKAAGRAKAILAEAEAQAKANRLLSESLTPTLVQYEMAKKWNGQMPQVTGSATPLLQLPTAAKP